MKTDPGVNLYDESAIIPPVMDRCWRCSEVNFDNAECECEKWGDYEDNQG